MADTVQLPKRWPLVVQQSNRGESFLQDARLTNCFAERDSNTGEYWVQKRICTEAYQSGVGPGGGLYNWQGDLYSIAYPGFSNVVMLKNGGAFDSWAGSFNVGQKYFFAEMQALSGGTPYLIFSGDTFVRYTSGGASALAALPSHGSFIRGVAVLDNTAYAMDENGLIMGSNITDPTTWPGTNTIQANSIAGTGKGLQQVLQYLFALKSNSCEVFSDNSNPTGSPLSAVKEANTNYGCLDGRSAQVIDNTLFYLSSNKTASPQLIRVDGVIPTPVSTPPIERLLDSAQQGGADGNIFSWVFKHGGHRFYGVTVQSLSLTLVYDIDQNLWYQWTNNEELGSSIFKLVDMSISSTFQHIGQGATAAANVIFGMDTALAGFDQFPVDIYTPNVDFGTVRRKTLHRMYFRTDQYPGSILYVRHSDNDYKSWSNFRRVDLSRPTPFLDGEGTFTRRAYHFRHFAPTPFRLRAVDLQMSLGTI